MAITFMDLICQKLLNRWQTVKSIFLIEQLKSLGIYVTTFILVAFTFHFSYYENQEIHGEWLMCICFSKWTFQVHTVCQQFCLIGFFHS